MLFRVNEGRDLEAQRLATAGGHDDQTVTASERSIDDLLLRRAKRLVAKAAT
jgi:hypothetical protein